MNIYQRSGKDEIREYGSYRVGKEVSFYQNIIDERRKNNKEEYRESLTLREMLGRKVSPAEGKRFKEYVRRGYLKDIEDIGKLSNKSNAYKIH